MIIEDGTASNVMVDMTTTPGLRHDTASSGVAYDFHNILNRKNNTPGHSRHAKLVDKGA